MPQLCLLLMLKCCFACKLMPKSPWKTKCAKSMQKDHKRWKKWPKTSHGRRSRQVSAPKVIGDAPKLPSVAEINRTWPFWESLERANRTETANRRTKSAKQACAPKWRSQNWSRQTKFKTASRRTKKATRSRPPTQASDEAKRRAQAKRRVTKLVRRTRLMSPNWVSGPKS